MRSSAVPSPAIQTEADAHKSGAEPLFSWLTQRMAGVLMHPTSLPGEQGIGVLDHSVDAWLRFLRDSGIRCWQVCPLGPTGYGDSPYQCFSAFAGNPYLIDLQALVEAGLLADADLAELRRLPREQVDFGWLYVTKWPVLFKAFDAFKSAPERAPYGDFAVFRKQHAAWLEPFALFLAIKDHFEGKPWWTWLDDVRFFSKARHSNLAKKLARRAEAHAFFQYLFFGQWAAVRRKAREYGVEIIGDAPIFVARDSADVWTHPELFQLDLNSGELIAVAGVPPDYFSADGQLWGNPLYHWEAHQADDYAWWRERLRANFALCDIVRIDHFRGFDTYWSIPATAKTAKTGEWKQGPGLHFFEVLQREMPDARLIAEDLGELFPSVLELRNATGLPGMTILQFAFGGDATNLYLPHNLRANSVVYPGTHDNDTTVGWYATASAHEQDYMRRYFRVSGQEPGWDFVRASYGAVSNLAVVPVQDLLNLGATARFNTPGKAAGNWQWRYSHEQLIALHRQSAAYLRELATLYGRLPAEPKPAR
ncbi:4-alpha-glucanotransferase [Geminisphaera colitermitum]|uniref:4-alpha-glucanotransferase n=1 Tax=Geminisphaera colitermitum TaxID=1148786 RepID=UPI000158D36D|nr:4-alpha-glucanotransferase [Geminisphaera colitermitum]